MTIKVKNKALSRQQELMRVFRFNRKMLEANRRGEITPQINNKTRVSRFVALRT